MSFYIQDNCVGCLKCVVECPKKAIHITEDRPAIDPKACISCGLCARICNEGAPVNTEKPVPTAPHHERLKKDCEVLVLGGGGAGMVAAARAAFLTGKKVIVLEKGCKTGGGAWYAADFKMFNSRWQKERGIPDVLDASLRKAMDDTYWRLDPQLARSCYEATGQFFDWMCDTGDHVEDEFREGFYIFDGPNGPKVPVFKKMRRGRQGGTGKYVMDSMLTLCQRYGVEVLTETGAVSMGLENGKVTSVLAKDAGGEVEITCKACVLATGSWIENRQLLAQTDPKFAAMPRVRSPHRSPKYTGDGLTIAENAGLMLDPESMCLRLMGPLFMPADDSEFTTLGAMTFDGCQLWVNEAGERWTCETFGSRSGSFFAQAIPLREQKNGASYTIFDANCVESVIRKQKNGAAPMGPFPAPPIPENWEEEMDAAVARFPFALYKAESLRELAEKLGVEPSVLEKTVARYNRICESGNDTDFSKEPEHLVPICRAPYYGLKCSMATDGAFGGIPITRSLNAMRQDGTPVENLFAAGDITSGRFVNQGGIKVQIINDLAWAFASGYLAGGYAAELAETL